MERLVNCATTTTNEVFGNRTPVTEGLVGTETGGYGVYPKELKSTSSEEEPKWETVSHTPLIEFGGLETTNTDALDELLMERAGEEYDALSVQLGNNNPREVKKSWQGFVTQNRLFLGLGIVALTTFSRITGPSSVSAEGLSNAPHTSQNSDPQKEGEGGLLEHPENPNYLVSCNGSVPEEIRDCSESDVDDWTVHRNNDNGLYYQCKPSIPWGVRLWWECGVEERAWDPVVEHPEIPGAYLVCNEEVDVGGCGQDPYRPGTVHKNEGDGENYYCDSHPEKGGVWLKCDTVGIEEKKPDEKVGGIKRINETIENISEKLKKTGSIVIPLAGGMATLFGVFKMKMKYDEWNMKRERGRVEAHQNRSYQELDNDEQRYVHGMESDIRNVVVEELRDCGDINAAKKVGRMVAGSLRDDLVWINNNPEYHNEYMEEVMEKARMRIHAAYDMVQREKDLRGEGFLGKVRGIFQGDGIYKGSVRRDIVYGTQSGVDEIVEVNIHKGPVDRKGRTVRFRSG